MKRNLLYAAGILISVAIVAFAYYALSPLFINIKSDDANPAMVDTLNMSREVVGTPGHPASGLVKIVQAEGKAFVRYENFKTINGPDIYVYLAKDLDAKEFVSLGKVKATEGNINYEIPQNVNPAEYKYVLTWCKQFGVLFNYADLAQRQ